MGEVQNTYKILDRKILRERIFGRSRLWWEENIKLAL
jgi:hypothetical protein